MQNNISDPHTYVELLSTVFRRDKKSGPIENWFQELLLRIKKIKACDNSIFSANETLRLGTIKSHFLDQPCFDLHAIGHIEYLH